MSLWMDTATRDSFNPEGTRAASPSFSNPPPSTSSEINSIDSKRASCKISFGTATRSSSRRVVNEDFIVQREITNTITLFGIVDGHSGVGCAKFISQAIPFAIQSLYESSLEEEYAGSTRSECDDAESWASILEHAFECASRSWDASGTLESGAVATFALVDCARCRMMIAHVGDCKVLASTSKSRCIELTKDHRCSDPEEAMRIASLGATVLNGRLHGLMPSRSFGDLNVRLHASRRSQRHVSSPEQAANIYAHCIKPNPDISFYSFTAAAEMAGCGSEGVVVLIASDGLFDVCAPVAALDHIRTRLALGDSPNAAAAHLLADLFANATASSQHDDDVSLIILSGLK